VGREGGRCRGEGGRVLGGGREGGAGGGEVPITVLQRYKGQAAVLSGPPHG
jgi:hypothetical protein